MSPIADAVTQLGGRRGQPGSTSKTGTPSSAVPAAAAGASPPQERWERTRAGSARWSQRGPNAFMIGLPSGWRRKKRESGELHRLSQRAVAGHVPRREPHPLRGGGHVDLEALAAEGLERGRRHDRAVGALPVAPDGFDEVERERPLHV